MCCPLQQSYLTLGTDCCQSVIYLMNAALFLMRSANKCIYQKFLVRMSSLAVSTPYLQGDYNFQQQCALIRTKNKSPKWNHAKKKILSCVFITHHQHQSILTPSWQRVKQILMPKHNFETLTCVSKTVLLSYCNYFEYLGELQLFLFPEQNLIWW